MKRAATCVFLLLMLSACGGQEPVVVAQDAGGQSVELAEENSDRPEALASNEPTEATPSEITAAASETTTTSAPEIVESTTTSAKPDSQIESSGLPWSDAVEAQLSVLFADDKDQWSEAKVACIADEISSGSEPTEDRVFELIDLYCDPAGYIDTWSETLTLPTAPGAERCFVTVYVEEATSGTSRDAAWFIEDRWQPPQPQRDRITTRLSNECALSEDDWFAAGMQLESSASWATFCEELGEVESKHSIISIRDSETEAWSDPAIYAQRLQDEIDDYSLLTPPADLSVEFEAFLTAQQLLQDFIAAGELNHDEYSLTLYDGSVTSNDIGISPEVETAWGRFQTVQYQDCLEF